MTEEVKMTEGVNRNDRGERLTPGFLLPAFAGTGFAGMTEEVKMTEGKTGKIKG